jgi:hypothetical protein
MKSEKKRERKSRTAAQDAASLEEMALYVMFLSEALFEVLSEKCLITHTEMTERMQKLRGRTKLKVVASDQVLQ